MALTVQRLKKKKDFGLQSVSEVLSTVIINQILSLLMKRHFLECVADCIAQDRISNSVGSFLQKLIPGSLLCMVQLFIATTCCRKWWVGKKPSHVCPFPLTLRQCSTPPPSDSSVLTNRFPAVCFSLSLPILHPISLTVILLPLYISHTNLPTPPQMNHPPFTQQPTTHLYRFVHHTPGLLLITSTNYRTGGFHKYIRAAAGLNNRWLLPSYPPPSPHSRD